MKNRTSKDNTIVRKKVQTRRFNADIRYGLNSDQVNEYFENGWHGAHPTKARMLNCSGNYKK